MGVGAADVGLTALEPWEGDVWVALFEITLASSGVGGTLAQLTRSNTNITREIDLWHTPIIFVDRCIRFIADSFSLLILGYEYNPSDINNSPHRIRYPLVTALPAKAGELLGQRTMQPSTLAPNLCVPGTKYYERH